MTDQEGPSSGREQPAGRELDEMVGKALGLEPTPGLYTFFGTDPTAHPVWPHYSTDIAAAWRVVEEMDVRWEGAFVEVMRHRDGYTCRIFDPGYRQFQDIEASAKAETAPLAICRAALKAVTREAVSQNVPSGASPHPTSETPGSVPPERSNG